MVNKKNEGKKKYLLYSTIKGIEELSSVNINQ
jgi:hypothetical protein